MLSIATILFPTDGSACAERAFGYAADLADRHDAVLHVLEVTAGTPAHAHADAPGGLCLVTAERYGSAPAPAILTYADEHGVDLIVMGTHGRHGLDRLIDGSVAEEVVRRARVPVLTVGPSDSRRPARPPQRVLVPVDFSAHSEHALRHARALADLYGAQLDLVHVVEEDVAAVVYGLEPVPVALGDVVGEARASLDAVAERVGATTAAVRVGAAAEGVVAQARDGAADLVVIATHGRTGLRHLLLGSVAEHVVRTAPCPVLVVKPLRPAPAPPAPEAADARAG